MICVKNYSKFQHYKNLNSRRPIWIKLYRSLLEDLEWHELSPIASKLLVNCWLLASEKGGELPNIRNIAFRLRVSEAVISELLPQLNHWLSFDASDLLANCYQTSIAEEEKEKEEEEEMRLKSHVEQARRQISTSDVEQVFAYWKTQLGHPKAKLTLDRRRKITARLSEGYTVSEIRQAIDGCRASPFHQGANDFGNVYDDIELICRSANKLEAFISRVASDEKPKIPYKESHNERAARETAELIERSLNASSNGLADPDPADPNPGWLAADFRRL